MKNLATLSAAIALVLGVNSHVFAADTTATTTTTAAATARAQTMLASLLKRFDLNNDGQITLDEVQAVRDAAFTKADTNSNAYLSTDELTALHTAEHQARAAEMFTTLDSNSDSKLSAAKLAAGSPHPVVDATRAQAHFTALDTDADGFVSLAELQAGVPPQGGHGGHRGGGQGHLAQSQGGHGRHRGGEQGHRAQLDTDSDGKISRTEYVSNVPLFDKFDTNSDGIITADEITTKLTQAPTGEGRGFGRPAGRGFAR